MSLYATGLDLDKACMLLALDAIFGDTIDWGKEFLTDYYIENGCIGFPEKHFYLIEESAPVTLLQYGSFAVSSYQERPYVYIYHKDTGLRYGIARNTMVILIYGKQKGESLHATAIPAREVTIYLQHSAFVGIFLQNAGLIVEQRTYEQDVEAGIIYE